MRSIAILNQKGGVGKTTTAVNVAAGLALAGHRVVLADLDPQSHATLHLGHDLGPDEPSLHDVLTRGASLMDVLRTVAHGLALAPAHLNLVSVEMELAERENREQLLAVALEPIRPAFDFLLIDCPPSLGLLTVNALAAVDEVIIPLQPHFLGLQGLGRLLETISLVRGVLKPALRVSGIVLCMYERSTRLAQEVWNDITHFVQTAELKDAWYGAQVFQSCIRRNIKLAESPSFGKTIFEYAPGSHGAEDYAALAREVMALRPPEIEPGASSAAASSALVAGAGESSRAPVRLPAEAANATPAVAPIVPRAAASG
jgi:chromosome partitioning protein